MMSSEQLERQTEKSRADVEQTLGELRARLTPGQIVDEVLAYARDGGGEFLTNFGRQVTNNPLPVTLIGAGLAWFLFSNGKGTNLSGMAGNGYNENWEHDGGAGYRAHGISGGIGDIAGKAGEKLGSAAEGVRDMANSATSALSDTAKSIGDTASSAYNAASTNVNRAAAAVADSATSLEHKTAAVARDMMKLMKDQPLILVGVGLALGAAVGAAVPNTEAENRLMGETADEVKKEAKEIGAQQLDRAKDAAQRFVDEGMSQPPENGGGQAGEMHGSAAKPSGQFG